MSLTSSTRMLPSPGLLTVRDRKTPPMLLISVQLVASGRRSMRAEQVLSTASLQLTDASRAALQGVIVAHGEQLTHAVVTAVGGVLHATVKQYLLENGYDYYVGKDKQGHSGAFLVTA